ncbi:MAG TPA: metalloregulator ArsR/SmtB family transcription factor [Chloroflexota bacterium]|nr:metalloregulator ArsR/SmtB family transcription factor [Chloroflexota bacterium]
MLRVEVDWAPAYELVVSLSAFVSRREHKTLELGTEWIKKVRAQISPDLARELSVPGAVDHVDAIDLLIGQCPGERGAGDFLHWFGSLSPGELYERLAPHIVKGRNDLLTDLDAFRRHHVALLTAWNEQYFCGADPAILGGLAAEAEATRQSAGTQPPSQLLEAVTNGLLLREEADETVLLVPQYHYRPWNLFSAYRDCRLILYPADAVPPAPGEPPPELVRVARALSDPSRLRLLRHLAQGPRSFSELVRFSGLSKSTVHHHMVILRAARLVRILDTDEFPGIYILRPAAFDETGVYLRDYLSADDLDALGEGEDHV